MHVWRSRRSTSTSVSASSSSVYSSSAIRRNRQRELWFRGRQVEKCGGKESLRRLAASSEVSDQWEAEVDATAEIELEHLTSVYGPSLPKLVLTRGRWRPATFVRCDQIGRADGHETGDEYLLKAQIKGQLMFKNTSKSQELFIPEITPTVNVLSKDSVVGIKASAKVSPRHDLSDGYESPDSAPRKDGYWNTFIMQGKCKTFIDVNVTIEVDRATMAESNWTTSEANNLLRSVTSCCLEVDYGCYGPSGLENYKQHVVLPVHFPDPTVPPLSKVHKTSDMNDANDSGGGGKRSGAYSVHSIPTHLLYHNDNPLDVIEKYVKPHVQPGDILAVAETPLAIMQGRYRHPGTVKPTRLAKLLCKLFHPTSSVATACGMQALLDVVGSFRALCAAVVGVLAKLFRIPGMFYKIAGRQAGLLDDISGTIAPYDKFICLGPTKTEAFVQSVKERFGLSSVVVDVNDLSKKTNLLTILASTEDVNLEFVHQALLPNPAGNADQQTPFVILRQL